MMTSKKDMEYVTEKLWDNVEKSNTKIAKRVYNALNRDIMNVVLEDKVFWFESVSSFVSIPNFVYKYAIKFYEKMGYTYLYNLPIK